MRPVVENGLAGREVGGGAGEGDPGAVRGEGRAAAFAVRLLSGRIGGDSGDRAGGEILDEDVEGRVGVAGDEIAGVAGKDDPGAVRRKGELDGKAVRGRAVGGGRQPSDRAGGEILDIPVGRLAPAGDEIGRERREQHLGPVGREQTEVGVVVRLGAGGVGRDPGDGAGDEILDEEIEAAVGVARHEIVAAAAEQDLRAVGGKAARHAGEIALHASGVGRNQGQSAARQVLDVDLGAVEAGREHHLRAVRRKDWLVASGAYLPARRIGGNARDRPGGQVPDEDVGLAVGVAGDEVARGAAEDKAGRIRGEVAEPAETVAAAAARSGRDPLQREIGRIEGRRLVERGRRRSGEIRAGDARRPAQARGRDEVVLELERSTMQAPRDHNPPRLRPGRPPFFYALFPTS